ncbi:MAG: PqqD family protein [Bacteroidetes bacterium]|nr:MAG: PqqD family protein [Bacteroidota bacterium]
MKLKRNIAISDSGFVFNPSTGDSYSLNPVGLEILTLAKAQKNKDEIRQYMLDNYLLDLDTFEKDFDDFANMLDHFNLIEK